MKFSLQDHFNSVASQLNGTRAAAFEEALKVNIQARDALWLSRLQYSQKVSSMEAPEGWEVREMVDGEPPSHKQEKSVFYWLQHAFYHQAFECVIPPNREMTISLPVFPAGFWPFLILTIGQGSRVTVQDDMALHSSRSTPFRSVLIQVGANADVRWKGYQHHASDLVSFDHKRFVLGESARLNFYHHVVGGFQNFDETLVELIGRNSEVFSQTVFFGADQQHHELRFNHLHLGQNTRSHMVSKGAVQDRSYGGFLGYIQMEPGCSGADGQLEEHNLLLSNTSKIDAVPGLEIGHHDVSAGHSAYMERVDEEKLFYLASRGIPQKEAVELIVEGFFRDALSRMEDPEREEIIFNHILSLLR